MHITWSEPRVIAASQDWCMPASERRFVQADRRAALALDNLGRELRRTRVSHGLSQQAVAAASGVQQAEVSRIEAGRRPGATIRTLARLATAVGLELSVRLYPAGEPIRDKAHIALLARFRQAIGESWTWAAEVPLSIPGDKRAWDRILRGAGVVIGVEAETRPTDLQEVQRRIGLKKRDGQVDRVVLVLANTEWNRRLVRLNDLEGAFPIPGRVALKQLAGGRDPGGDAAILI
jgi:transcriptional regulator with XRE-family HTH domain